MKNRFVISEEERERILNLHESRKNSHGTVMNEQYAGVAFGNEPNGLKIKKVEATEQVQAGGTTPGLKTDNPESVTLTQNTNGRDVSITISKNGTFVSQSPLDSNNPKSNRGTWKFNPKQGSQFGGGYIDFYVNGFNILSQELNGDIPGNDAVQTLISQNKPAYMKLPVMTKLANMGPVVIDTRGAIQGQGPEAVAGKKVAGCPAGCIKDPNYKGTPQKWAPVK